MKRLLLSIGTLVLAVAIYGSGDVPFKGTDVPPRGYAYDHSLYYDVLTHTLHVYDISFSTSASPVPNATKWNGYSTPSVTGPLYKYSTFFGTFTPTIAVCTAGTNVGSFSQINFAPGSNVTM